MQLVFVHGWSVRSTATYGQLPTRLEQELGCAVEHIQLGKYVSFDDDVTLDDLALAFDAALTEKSIRDFACITHSTGGPLLRHWYSKQSPNRSRLKHLIMLAPANHGSALAQLGKGRLGRIKAFFESVEPGQRILDWLELGSEEQWLLNRQWLESDPVEGGMLPFVLTGDSIDRKLYDHLNSYTGEPGGDGVVRVAAANLNYEYVRLEQSSSGELLPIRWRRAPRTAFRIIPGMAHGGEEMGIMTSVGLANPHPTVEAILDCLKLRNEGNYLALCDQWQSQAGENCRNEGNAPHSMVVFRVLDDRGELLKDFDLLFTAGEDSSPDALPRGFFRDRQRNSKHRGKLTYFLDYSKIADTPIGFRIEARPDSGLVFYKSGFIPPARLAGIIRPHETLMVEIVLRRQVDRASFQLTKDRRPDKFGRQPSGELIPRAA